MNRALLSLLIVLLSLQFAESIANLIRHQSPEWIFLVISGISFIIAVVIALSPI